MSKTFETTKNVAEILALFLAGLWAVYTFVYKEHLAPRNSAPLAVVSTSISDSKQSPNGYSIKLSSSLRNTGKPRIHVIGYWFNVIGVTFADRQDMSDQEYSDLLADVYIPGAYEIRARRHHVVDAIRIIDSGTFFDDGWWLDTNEAISQERAILIPGSYDMIKIHVYANIAKNIDFIDYRWEMEEGDEMRQVKLLIIDGQAQEFDVDNQEHEGLREDYGLSLIKSEAVFVVPET